MSTENQPEPGAFEVRRNCTNCAFSKEAHEPPPSIQKIRVCCFNPPQMVAMPTPRGVNLQIMFPPVNETILCNQHRLLTEVANANSRPTEGQPN